MPRFFLAAVVIVSSALAGIDGWPEWGSAQESEAVALKRGGDDDAIALKRGGDDDAIALKRGGDDDGVVA